MGFFQNDAGNNDLKTALDKINAATPTAAQLTLPQLQQFVQQGVLSPQEYQAVLADPATYSKIIQSTQDSSGANAQKAALQQLSGTIQAGGSTDINKANLLNNINQTNQAMKASRDAISENAQERGVSGGGLEFMQKLADEQGNATTANSNAVNSAANNAQLALNSIAQQGQIGSTLQSQANQMSEAQAQAAQQIAQYNSQLQSSANQYNTQTANEAQAANLAEKQQVADNNTANANMRTQFNATVPETVFNNAIGAANEYNNLAGAKNSQQSQDNAFTGQLLGTAGTVLGGMYGGPAGAAIGGAAGKAVAGGGTDVGAGGTYQGTPEAAGQNSNQYSPYKYPSTNGYAKGGMVKCYAEGGEVHDHQLCMKAGGGVPGSAPVPGDSPVNDTVDAKLSPGEVVIPRSITQAPDAPAKAAGFVAGQQGGSMMPTVSSFAEALKMLESQGIELTLSAKGA